MHLLEVVVSLLNYENIFNQNNNIISQIIPGILGQKMNEFFDLVRPIIEFAFDVVLARSNNIFEVMTNEPIEVLLKAGGKEVHTSQNEDAENDMGDLMGEDEDKSLHLKGQMLFMAEWGVIMFLSSPILTDMDSLNVNGLFVNDLPMHDFSRDLLFVGMYVFSIICNS